MSPSRRASLSKFTSSARAAPCLGGAERPGAARTSRRAREPHEVGAHAHASGRSPRPRRNCRLRRKAPCPRADVRDRAHALVLALGADLQVELTAQATPWDARRAGARWRDRCATRRGWRAGGTSRRWPSTAALRRAAGGTVDRASWLRARLGLIHEALRACARRRAAVRDPAIRARRARSRCRVRRPALRKRSPTRPRVAREAALVDLRMQRSARASARAHSTSARA